VQCMGDLRTESILLQKGEEATEEKRRGRGEEHGPPASLPAASGRSEEKHRSALVFSPLARSTSHTTNMVGAPPRRLRHSLLSSLLLASTLTLAVAASSSPLIEDNSLGVFGLSNSDFDDPLDPRNSFEESAPFELYGDESSVWHHHGKRTLGKAWKGTTKLAQAGTSGVGAM
jgi:hypothetical protein